MAKKVIERIVKVVNILINMVMTFVSVASFMHYGTSGYMYSDDIYRLPWVIGMFIIVNAADYIIRKRIREF